LKQFSSLTTTLHTSRDFGLSVKYNEHNSQHMTTVLLAKYKYRQ